MTGGIVFWLGALFGMVCGLTLSALIRAAKRGDEIEGAMRYWNRPRGPNGLCQHGPGVPCPIEKEPAS